LTINETREGNSPQFTLLYNPHKANITSGISLHRYKQKQINMGYSRQNWHSIANVIVVLSILLWYDHIRVVSGFPSGAGGCTGGEAAVGGVHLTRPETANGTLAQTGITVAIDGTPLEVNKTLTFLPNTDLEITIEGTDFDFKGFLMRVQAPTGYDTTDVILPNDDFAKVADACSAPITGITHVDSSDKPIATGVVNFPEEVDSVDFDITVVFLNDVNRSAFAYSRFTASFRQTSQVPVASISPISPSAPTPPSSPITPNATATPSLPTAPSAPATPSSPNTPSAPTTPSAPITPNTPTLSRTPTIVDAASSTPTSLPTAILAPATPVTPTVPVGLPPIPPLPPLPLPMPINSASPSPTPHSIFPPFFGKFQ
jgi:hypothetical protein